MIEICAVPRQHPIHLDRFHCKVILRFFSFVQSQSQDTRPVLDDWCPCASPKSSQSRLVNRPRMNAEENFDLKILVTNDQSFKIVFFFNDKEISSSFLIRFWNVEFYTDYLFEQKLFKYLSWFSLENCQVLSIIEKMDRNNLNSTS